MENTSTQCTCSETVSRFSEVCASCRAEYEQWLADEEFAAAQEARLMSGEQLAELAELAFEAAHEIGSNQLKCQVRKLNAELWSAA